jgi:hypothetical protein
MIKTLVISILLSFAMIQYSFGVTDEQYQDISFLIEQNNIEKSFELLKEVQSSEKKIVPKIKNFIWKILY